MCMCLSCFSDRERAVEMGQQLIDRHFGYNVKTDEIFRDDQTYYRLMEDDETSALNSGSVSECEPQPGSFFWRGGRGSFHLILKIKPCSLKHCLNTEQKRTLIFSFF